MVNVFTLGALKLASLPVLNAIVIASVAETLFVIVNLGATKLSAVGRSIVPETFPVNSESVTVSAVITVSAVNCVNFGKLALSAVMFVETSFC